MLKFEITSEHCKKIFIAPPTSVRRKSSSFSHPLVDCGSLFIITRALHLFVVKERSFTWAGRSILFRLFSHIPADLSRQSAHFHNHIARNRQSVYVTRFLPAKISIH